MADWCQRFVGMCEAFCEGSAPPGLRGAVMESAGRFLPRYHAMAMESLSVSLQNEMWLDVGTSSGGGLAGWSWGWVGEARCPWAKAKAQRSSML